ncbi:Zn-dependent hydrolase [Paenibacillus naphthalenovorans]|uniref:Allantoate amidohydrolase n=1 Tax=Paenibacillus naphthalenovorans TaxID=162209 RepID=A0A0U2VYY8_9BACL|nr:Zn-dependent hydrolase [Paenibacillus naphthalenovorans]ALS20453.1 allantoate amidohydrolase [Paenibacillus naphthalenovorans]
MADKYVTELQVSDSDRSRFAADIQQAIEWLADYGKDASGGVTRFLYSDAWSLAQQALARRMAEAGLHAYYDDCGNLFGRLEGSRPDEPVLLTGSHLDTVKCGGRYDGAYGILAGMIALTYLQERFGAPRRTLEVVSLCEEEGSRFPLTYWGSGNITGKYALDAVPAIRDIDGISLQEAMEAAGFGLGRYPSPRRSALAGFIELHIEQGLVLERERLSIGIVDGIVGQKRFMVRVDGTANHAGTTPMKLRRDALAGACEMIAFLEKTALSQREPFVATTGQLQVQPNLANVIPGQVVFTVDVRDADSEVLEQFCSTFKSVFAEIAERRQLSVDFHEWMSMHPVRMNVDMNRSLASICEGRGLAYRSMFSGAGHDAQMFQAVCPTTMLFVPSKEGISHSPLEYSDPRDLADGIVTLVEWLYLYGYKEELR